MTSGSVGTYLRLGRSQAGVRSGGGQVVAQLVRGRRGSAAPGGGVALRVETSEHHRCSKEREREREKKKKQQLRGKIRDKSLVEVNLVS